MKKKKGAEKHYVYIALCSDGTFYTGYTNNLRKREDIHNKGKGSKYTRSRLPVRFIYAETFTIKESALKREYEMKQMTRIKKMELIEKIN